jgi:hypothetical protein
MTKHQHKYLATQQLQLLTIQKLLQKKQLKLSELGSTKAKGNNK